MNVKLLLAWGLFLVTLSVGCTGKKAPTPQPTSGQVTWNNAPLVNASVVFHPVDAGSTDIPKPQGKTDSQGRFQLTTFKENDGAPAGRYRVTIEVWQTLRPDEGPTSLLPKQYGQPSQSGIEVTINSGNNELEVFNLK